MFREEKCKRCGKIFFPTHEWVYKDNGKYYCSWTCYNHRKEKGTTKPHYNSKRVKQYTLDGKPIAEFFSANYAAEAVGCKAEGIRMVCRGELKSYKGFVWKYKDECN